MWEDFRNDWLVEIYGARVDADGTVADPGGVQISNGEEDEYAASVAGSGGQALVGWQDPRNYWEGDLDIYGARFDGDGTVLDGDGFSLSNSANVQIEPAVAWDGENYLVAWTDRRSTGHTDVYGARIAPDGQLLDGSGIPISTGPEDEALPAIVSSGSGYFVVWRDERDHFRTAADIYGTRVSSAGQVLDPDGIAIENSFGGPENLALATSGRQYLVLWDNGDEVFGLRVALNGVPLDPSGFLVGPLGNDEHLTPAVAWGEDAYLVAWQNGRFFGQTRGARVSEDGDVLDPSGISISTEPSQCCPSVAWSGQNFLVAWSQDMGDSVDIHGARVAPTGVVLDPTSIPIATRPGSKYCLDGMERGELPRRVGGRPCLDGSQGSLWSCASRTGVSCSILQAFRSRPRRIPRHALGSSQGRRERQQSHTSARRATVNTVLCGERSFGLSRRTRSHRRLRLRRRCLHLRCPRLRHHRFCRSRSRARRTIPSERRGKQRRLPT